MNNLDKMGLNLLLHMTKVTKLNAYKYKIEYFYVFALPLKGQIWGKTVIFEFNGDFIADTDNVACRDWWKKVVDFVDHAIVRLTMSLLCYFLPLFWIVQKVKLPKLLTLLNNVLFF